MPRTCVFTLTEGPLNIEVTRNVVSALLACWDGNRGRGLLAGMETKVVTLHQTVWSPFFFFFFVEFTDTIFNHYRLAWEDQDDREDLVADVTEV